QGHHLEAVEKHQEKRREPHQTGMSQRQGSLICVCTTRMCPLCSHVPEQVYQKYTPEEERPPDHRGILRYGGRKVHEIICTNRPVPNGTLGGVRGSDDTYSIVRSCPEKSRNDIPFSDTLTYGREREIT
ncbi:hypothetical protein, partial [Faecalibaculum rodentium]|uniref:hypothetical protein n=1 Tax=Faecalibaculum rodentium TaxID=1702221 RepID=UPI0023F06271